MIRAALACVLFAGCYYGQDFSKFSTGRDLGAAPDADGQPDASGPVSGWWVERDGDFSDLWAVSGSATRVVAVGDSGTLLENLMGFPGWTPIPNPGGAAMSFRGVWVDSAQVAAVGLSGLVVEHTPGLLVTHPSGFAEDLQGITRDSSKIFDLVGADGRNAYGTDLATLTTRRFGALRLHAVYRDVMVGDQGTMFWYDVSLTSWQPGALGLPATSHLYGLGGYDRANLFAVGVDGAIVGINGLTGTRTALHILGGGTLFAVSLPTAALGYAVGAGGAIARFQDGTWTWLPKTPTTRDLHGVWGNTNGGFVAVGQGGVILRCCR